MTPKRPGFSNSNQDDALLRVCLGIRPARNAARRRGRAAAGLLQFLHGWGQSSLNRRERAESAVASAPGRAASESGTVCHDDGSPRTGQQPPEGTKIAFAPWARARRSTIPGPTCGATSMAMRTGSRQRLPAGLLRTMDAEEVDSSRRPWRARTRPPEHGSQGIAPQNNQTFRGDAPQAGLCITAFDSRLLRPEVEEHIDHPVIVDILEVAALCISRAPAGPNLEGLADLRTHVEGAGSPARARRRP